MNSRLDCGIEANSSHSLLRIQLIEIEDISSDRKRQLFESSMGSTVMVSYIYLIHSLFTTHKTLI